MRYWQFVQPGGDNDEPIIRVVSEAEIIATYYAWWSEQMRKVGKDEYISERSCIEDWVVVHWASEHIVQ